MKYHKIQVHQLSSNFEEATAIVEAELPELKHNQILIQVCSVAINASDINFTNGVYLPGVQPPFDCGFECIGTVQQSQCQQIKQGQAVLYIGYGTFAEYVVADGSKVIPLPSIDPKFYAVGVSGLTASLSLNQVQLKGQTVFITAAAGALGSIACQWAKSKGALVIGTTSNKDKEDYLKSLGVDDIVNYKTVDVGQYLKKKYPKGIDVAFETVGGKMLHDCLDNLSRRGTLLVIGSITNYKTSESSKNNTKGQPFEGNKWPDAVYTMDLLSKSKNVQGFFLNDYADQFPQVIPELIKLVHSDQIKLKVDSQDFNGLQDVKKAVKFLHAGKSCGKVVVPMPQSKL